MKRSLLSFFAIILLGVGSAVAQCTPDPLYADSTFGAWPDTITDFPPAQQGVFYSEVLNFKVPTDGGDIDPMYTGVTIDSFEVVAVVGLPSCLTYATNHASGSYLGGEQGCALISGTCNTPGSHNVTIQAKGWTTFITPVAVPYDFEGYNIDILAVGVEERTQKNLYVIDNYPNPFNGTTTITYGSTKNIEVMFEVYNLIGNRVYSNSYQANGGQNTIQFDGSNLSSGQYFYTLTQGEEMITRKMTIAAE